MQPAASDLKWKHRPVFPFTVWLVELNGQKIFLDDVGSKARTTVSSNIFPCNRGLSIQLSQDHNKFNSSRRVLCKSTHRFRPGYLYLTLPLNRRGVLPLAHQTIVHLVSHLMGALMWIISLDTPLRTVLLFG